MVRRACELNFVQFFCPETLGRGDYLPPRHDLTLPLTIAPQVSLRGYGPVPSASPEGSMPFVSGHAVFLMPSVGRDVPLARPWLRPMD